MAAARLNDSNNMSLAVGLETIIRPNLLNQVRAGYLYTRAAFGQGGSDGFYTNPTINYGYGGYDDNYEMPNSRKQPILSVSDTLTWVKGSHTMGFGFNAYREVNQYWDPPEGFTLMSLGMDTKRSRAGCTDQAGHPGGGRPRCSVADRRRMGERPQLYAMLAGRINNFWGRHAYLPATGAYATGSTPDSERGRVLDVGRAADVLGCLRPGFLAHEAELHGQHGPALGLRLARRRPDREVSLADARRISTARPALAISSIPARHR